MIDTNPAALDLLKESPDGRWRVVLDHWRKLSSGGTRIPLRSEIDPLELTITALPNIAIIQKTARPSGKPGHRLRLVGEALTDFFDVRAGQFLEDLAPATETNLILNAQHRCMQGEIIAERVSLSWKRKDRSCLVYRKLLLPFSENGAEIDTVLALIIFDQQPLVHEHIQRTEQHRKLGPSAPQKLLCPLAENSVDRLSA